MTIIKNIQYTIMTTNEKNDIRLSVLDVENKYKVDYTEYIYGSGNNSDKPVSWGEDNALPSLYMNCYSKSSTLKATIMSQIDYVLGDEIIVSDDAAYWKEQVNRNGMTMKDLVAKLAFNYAVYGGISLQVVYNRLGQVVELFPLDFGRCRVNENKTKVFYNKKWGKWTAKYDVYDAFDPEHIDMDNPTQIYWFKPDYSSAIYPLPQYNGALYDILTEIEASKYSLNTVARGFSARYLIQFPENRNITDEQKKGIEDAIKNKFCGSDTDTSFMLYWRNGDGDAEKIEISKIETDDAPEKYLAIKDTARTNIFIAMRTSPLICGLPVSTAFSTDEFKDSFKLYNKTVITPIQDIIKGCLSKITGIPNIISFAQFDIDFTQE